MMNREIEIKTEPSEIWGEFQQGLSYNTMIGLNRDVQRNEDFFVGKQWEGVVAPELDKPVMNILRRTVNYFIANLCSDNIGVRLDQFSCADGEHQQQYILNMLSDEIRMVMERTNFRKLSRYAIRDAAVDGDACLHYYFDTEADKEYMEGQTPGQIKAQLVDNVNVFFSDPQDDCVESQNYILIAFRQPVASLFRAKNKNGHGVEENQEISETTPEMGVNRQQDGETGKVTVVRKYWKKDGHVWYTDVTENIVLQKPTDSGYSRYPLVWMSWERVKNRFHGVSAISGMIPNQIIINKLNAMLARYATTMAFKKLVVDRNRVTKWSNRIGETIEVNGDVNTAVAMPQGGTDMPTTVVSYLSHFTNETRETMGTSDAALGNVNPTNTSAIIATQQATSFPLTLQKLAFYDFVESTVRIWLDMMGVKYGIRNVVLEEDELTPETRTDAFTGLNVNTGKFVSSGKVLKLRKSFDFSQIVNIGYVLDINVGASSYWSEITQTTTLSNLLASGVLPVDVFLKYIPNNAVPNKDELLKDIKSQMAQQQQESSDAQKLASLMGQGQQQGVAG